METLNVRLEKRIIYKKKEKNLISVLIFENMSLPPNKNVSLIIKSGAMGSNNGNGGGFFVVVTISPFDINQNGDDNFCDIGRYYSNINPTLSPVPIHNFWERKECKENLQIRYCPPS